ncbi:hypothetical protein ACTQ45_13215 [Fundicoccus sp. Sow4_D5]|uniref:hypothetical protein n=1 Tax=Fundicoccus sp. Sow4_D5 TaxID=3438782 RepID=UPI003F9189FE
MKETAKKKLYQDFYLNQQQIEADVESAYANNEELTIVVYNDAYDQVDTPDNLIKVVLANYRWLVEVYLWLHKQEDNIDKDRITCFINESCLLITVATEETESDAMMNNTGKLMEA